MPVADWFAEFVAAHQRRHPRQDWPDPAEGGEFYAAWREQFVRGGITADVAEEASVALVADPPKFVGEHIPALLKAASEVFRRRAAEGRGLGNPTDSAEAARQASRDCPDCGASGLATRYRHASARGPNDTVTLSCLCPMGRFVAASEAKQARERGGKVIPDLARFPQLQLGPVPWSDAADNRYRYPPDLWDDFDDRPLTPEEFLAAHPDLPPSLVAAIRLHGEPTFVRHLPAWEAAPPPSPVGRRHLAAIGRDANAPF